MEPFILLLASFAVLGILDIIGGQRINVKYILFFAAIFVFIFLYNVGFGVSEFIESSNTLNLAEIFGSAIVILLFPGIGIGDKIFLATTFLVYPFWIMWLIIFLALILTKPVFRLIAIFIKSRELSVPFYPFLFLSSLIAYAVIFVLL